jgi:hypothetical protein
MRRGRDRTGRGYLYWRLRSRNQRGQRYVRRRFPIDRGNRRNYRGGSGGHYCRGGRSLRLILYSRGGRCGNRSSGRSDCRSGSRLHGRGCCRFRGSAVRISCVITQSAYWTRRLRRRITSRAPATVRVIAVAVSSFRVLLRIRISGV